MRRTFNLLILFCSFVVAVSASAATGKVIKVLPHYLDTKGQHAKSPSLFDRDAYQAWLQRNPAECSGIRYDVQWKARDVFDPLKLRLELRGIATGNLPRQKTVEVAVKAGSGWSRWTGVSLTGEDYKAFGKITAWRVTLWDGEQLVGEEKSFLW